MTRIFISYRSVDEPFAAAFLDDKLSARFGKENVFRDSDIPPGEDFRPILWRRLARSDALLVVMGARWLVADVEGHRPIDDPDDFVREEIGLALRLGLRVVPVLLGDTALPPETELPSNVAPLAHRQFRRLHPSTMEYDVQRIVDELTQIPVATSEVTPRTEPRNRFVLLATNVRGPAYPAVSDERVRAALTRSIETALADAGLAATVHRGRVPVALIDQGIAGAVPLAADFVRALDARLAAAADSWPDPRVLLVVHEGPIVEASGAISGDGFNVARQILDAPLLAGVLDAAPRARLVVALTDRVFRGVRDAYEVDTATYASGDVEVDGWTTTIWVHVPEYPSPPGMPRDSPHVHHHVPPRG